MKKFTLILLLLSSTLRAQILDDSTRLIYGPHTTRYIYEHNIKYNDLYFQEVDTSILNIHRFTTTELSGYRLQDLGVMGTATRPMYYVPPDIIGARSGFYVYEPFFRKPADFKYYDTKSPYSRIGAAIGARGRNKVDVGFNRSDSSNFNIGIDYNRIATDKQVASKGRNDRLADSEGYDAYLVYYTPNRRYLVMTNFSRNKTTVADQGGVDTTGGFSFFDRDANVFLTNATTTVLRRQFHLYQQFMIDSVFQVYATYDNEYASAQFRIPDFKDDKDYFDRFIFSNDTTSDKNRFITNTFEGGLKGSIAGKLFYLGYYKYRKYDFAYAWGNSDTLGFRTGKPPTIGEEHYLGGAVRIQLNRKYKLQGSIDFNLNGNQRLTGDLFASNFEAHLVTQQYQPSFMERAYLGNHDFWINDFTTIKALQVNGSYTQPVGRSLLTPRATFTSLTNYVYYDTAAVPRQIDGTTTVIQPGVDLTINFLKNLYFTAQVDYNIVAGNTPEALPMPQWMVSGNLYYHNLHFNNNLEIQAGIDSHWKSDYYAPDYRESTQQYFIQDEFLIPSYLILDLYVNIKLGHAYVFGKMNNLVEAITKEGYFVAPYYVGKKPLFDFGFYWMFFD